MALTKTPIELSSTPGIVDNSNATAITIDSSERVLIGKTATGLGASGTEINPNGYIQVTEDQSPPLYLNRLSTDGSIVNFYKDSTAVGSIGTNAATMYVSAPQAGGMKYSYLTSTNAVMLPVTTTGASADGLHDLGLSAARFRDLYLSGGAYLGGTAAANKLEDYEEGTWTPTLVGYYGTYGTTINQGTRTGTYTKVGNLVTLSMNIENAGVASANNGDIIAISGLPFTASSTATAGSSASTSVAKFVGGAWTHINFTQLGHLGNNGTSGSVWTWLTGGNFATAGVSIRLTISYRH